MNKSVCYLILAHVLDNVKLEKKTKQQFLSNFILQ